MKFELVEDWRNAWRWLSVNCMVLAGAIQGSWLFVPEDMKASIPPHITSGVTVILLVIGVAGRLKKQAPCEPKP
jgi:hypothetical protein